LSCKTSTALVVGLPRILPTHRALCSRDWLNYILGSLKKKPHPSQEIIASKSMWSICSLTQYLWGPYSQLLSNRS